MPALASSPISVRPLPWRADPRTVAAAWPPDLALLMLHSARRHPRWARWSILATPRAFFAHDGRRSRLRGDLPAALAAVRLTDDPLLDLDALLAAARTPPARGAGGAALPFGGGFVGLLSYDLGRRIEPTGVCPGGARDDRRRPLLELGWCDGALVHDGADGSWWAVGEAPLPDAPRPAPPRGAGELHETGPLGSSMTRRQYADAVRRTIEYIRRGDVFQVNVAQRFTADFRGSTRRLALDAFAISRPWYGACLELPGGRAAVSLSPELFLQIEPTGRRIVTRPVKGTRPAHVDRRELLESAKDAAELHMIIDLLRNDLGRVCEFGSISVPCGRKVEAHPTVHHGVGEVRGRLRPEVTAGSVIRAAFPGGSITGAPKIRAMQIIDELEPVRRGPYCGAIGAFSRCGSVCLNVAIRTMLLDGVRPAGRYDRLEGTLDYGAGSGIVADSDPELEYEETLAKTRVLQLALERAVSGRPSAVGPCLRMAELNADR